MGSSSNRLYNFRLIWFAAIASLGGLLFGFNTGIISTVLLHIPKEWGLGTVSQGLVVSGVLLGAVFGAAISGKLSDSLGRRDVILVTAAVYALGTFTAAVASAPVMLVVGRIIVGIAIGCTSVTVPLYISEIAPARIRGMLVSFNQFAITLGILASFAIGTLFLDHGFSWRSMLLCGVAPAVMLGVGVLLLPESPRWLVLQEDAEKARQIFALMGAGDVESDINRISQNLEATRGITLPDLFKPQLRRLLVIGVGVFVVQQFTGINAVLYYAPTIFKMAGFESESAAFTALVSLGLVNVLATVVGMLLVDRIGRRPLLLTGLVGMVVCLIVMGFAVTSSVEVGSIQKITAMGSLLLFVAFFAVGIGLVGWLIISEIYPLAVRGTAMSLPAACHWASNIVVSVLFLTLLDQIGPALTFWLFAVIGIIGVLFLSGYVPETKMKSLEDIESEWVDQRAIAETERGHFRLWLIACFASLGGLIAGYDLAVIGGAMLEIRKTWTLSLAEEGMVVSSFLVGATVAAAFSGKLADNFGRRTIVLAIAVFFVTGAYVSGLAASPAWLIAGRLIIGMSTGVAMFAIPLYLCEIAPPTIRGALVLLSQLALTAGELLAFLVTSLFDEFGEGWRDMFTVAAIPSAILAVGMLFLPESPSWMLFKKDPGGTRRMLRKLGIAKVDRELANMKQARSLMPKVVWRDLLKPWLRMPLVIGIVIMVLQQVTGNSVVMHYGPTLFQAAGFESGRSAMLASAGLGLVDFSMILLSMKFVDSIGRRPLLLVGLMGMVISLGIMGLAFHLKESDFLGPHLKWMVLASLLAYMVAFGTSLGPVSGLVASELYPLSIRGLGMSIASFFSLGAASLVSFSFPSLVAALGDAGTFWLYGVIAAAGWIFCLVYAPETKGKTLEEIEQHWLLGKPARELR